MIKSKSINICTKFSNCPWMKIAKIDLPKWSGKRSKFREKSVKSQGIFKRILSGNPATLSNRLQTTKQKKALVVIGTLRIRINYRYLHSECNEYRRKGK